MLWKKIRSEEGNPGYNYYVSLQDPQTVLLLDSWENQEALDIHHASPMMKEIMDLREKYHLSMRAQRYVTDDEGFSENDKKYMK